MLEKKKSCLLQYKLIAGNKTITRQTLTHMQTLRQHVHTKTQFDLQKQKERPPQDSLY